MYYYCKGLTKYCDYQKSYCYYYSKPSHMKIWLISVFNMASDYDWTSLWSLHNEDNRDLALYYNIIVSAIKCSFQWYITNINRNCTIHRKCVYNRTFWRTLVYLLSFTTIRWIWAKSGSLNWVRIQSNEIWIKPQNPEPENDQIWRNLWYSLGFIKCF